MDVLWFAIVSGMLTIYAVLDGFDLGAGAIHLIVARSPRERGLILRAIGPVWDGNEVWLIAAAGTLYFAFPAVYASSFSGFYLPLMIVLWLLIVRGVSVEVRSHISEPLWHALFDALFAGSSILLAVFFGAALGNVIRGVPLGPDGYFFEPLWTSFTPTPAPGILDWYTVLTGSLTLIVLASHGAHFVAVRSTGAIHDRTVRIATRLWPWMLALALITLGATLWVRPSMITNYIRWPAGWVIPGVAVASVIATSYYRRRGRDVAAFVGSSLFLSAMLGGVAFGLYPVLLPSSNSTNPSLTAINALAPSYGLRVGLRWWTIGFLLAVCYVIRTYWFIGTKEEGTGMPEGTHGG